jgi:hypothetical protein
VKKKRELSYCLTLSLLGGGEGTVTAGFFFAAADEDATEEFFVSRPVSFLCPFFVGIVSGCGSWMARRIAMRAILWV